MLALIAGTGTLPPELIKRMDAPPLVCALDGFAPDVGVDIRFRLEHLGRLLQDLTKRGVKQVCMAGAVRRPSVDPTKIDPLTLPMVPKIMAALAQGDDGALRVIISLFEEAGIEVVAAHQLAPDLLPQVGVPTQKTPEQTHHRDAHAGAMCVARLGQADLGQACIIGDGAVIASEGAQGTQAMLAATTNGQGAILFKAPKPHQDMRADVPVIGPDTARQAKDAGLAGIVIEAGGVMVLDQPQTCAILNAQEMFLWVRPRGAA